MIKFFRKIRQNLLLEGNTGKYLKYAIGEIILVVIGILIALQINNWNEGQKSARQEKTYYCKIAEDLQVDIQNIDSSLVTLDKRLENTERFLKTLLKTPNDKQGILKYFIPTFRHYRFIPTKPAIVDITSSGKLETLRNQTLKNRILSHYTEQENALQIIAVNEKGHYDKFLEIENYSDFGIQEVPEYQNIFDEELQGLLSSRQWQQNPKNEFFVKIMDVMLLAVIINSREKQLLKGIKADAIVLTELLVENCN